MNRAHDWRVESDHLPAHHLKNAKAIVQKVEDQQDAADHAAKSAKSAGASDTEAVKAGLGAAMPGAEITDEMIQNLKKANRR